MSPPSFTAANSAHHESPRLLSGALEATWIASRVLPVPPGPTRVTSLWRASIDEILDSSLSRSTSGVTDVAKLTRSAVPADARPAGNVGSSAEAAARTSSWRFAT